VFVPKRGNKGVVWEKGGPEYFVLGETRGKREPKKEKEKEDVQVEDEVQWFAVDQLLPPISETWPATYYWVGYAGSNTVCE
jgi:hypothetical protein